MPVTVFILWGFVRTEEMYVCVCGCVRACTHTRTQLADSKHSLNSEVFINVILTTVTNRWKSLSGLNKASLFSPSVTVSCLDDLHMVNPGPCDFHIVTFF